MHKLHADRSGVRSKAFKVLGIMPQGSQPGVPQTKAVAERANGDVLAGTRYLLLAAGLPSYFWEYAMRCYGLFYNLCRVGDEGVSPWARTHGGVCQGEGVVWEQGILQVHDGTSSGTEVRRSSYRWCLCRIRDHAWVWLVGHLPRLEATGFCRHGFCDRSRMLFVGDSFHTSS